MNVAELIAMLDKIENKDKPVEFIVWEPVDDDSGDHEVHGSAEFNCETDQDDLLALHIHYRTID